MFAMFNKFFSMLTKLFSAGENLAQALENISTITVEMSGEYMDEARAKRITAAKQHLITQ